MTTITNVPGIKMTLGGTDYIVPPLNLKALRALQSRLEAFNGGMDGDSIGTVVDALHASLLRNYPDMTRERVEEIIGLENMDEAMRAVMDVSGLLRKEGEAKDSAGEDLTGASSTPT